MQAGNLENKRRRCSCLLGPRFNTHVFSKHVTSLRCFCPIGAAKPADAGGGARDKRYGQFALSQLLHGEDDTAHKDCLERIARTLEIFGRDKDEESGPCWPFRFGMGGVFGPSGKQEMEPQASPMPFLWHIAGRDARLCLQAQAADARTMDGRQGCFSSLCPADSCDGLSNTCGPEARFA